MPDLFCVSERSGKYIVRARSNFEVAPFDAELGVVWESPEAIHRWKELLDLTGL